MSGRFRALLEVSKALYQLLPVSPIIGTTTGKNIVIFSFDFEVLLFVIAASRNPFVTWLPTTVSSTATNDN